MQASRLTTVTSRSEASAIRGSVAVERALSIRGGVNTTRTYSPHRELWPRPQRLLALFAVFGTRYSRQSLRTRSAYGKTSRGPSTSGGDRCIDVQSAVQVDVPEELLASIPAEVRADVEARERYLRTALEIGIKALAQAGVSLDTSYVKSTFQEFEAKIERYRAETQHFVEDLLKDNLTGEDSRLARLLLGELGDRGRLANLLDDAHRRMADPSVKTSLPNVVTKLVSGALQEEHKRLDGLVNAADPESPLGLFLARQQQAVQLLQEEYITRLVKLEDRLDQKMAEIRVALNVDEKLQGLQDAIDSEKNKSTSKGLVFERQGYDALVEMASVFGDMVEPCGQMHIDGTQRKVADHMIHVHQPGMPECTIAIEQKAGRCARKTLLQQMGEAMEYRRAQAVIGVMQRKYLGKRQSAYEQHGPVQIIVGVDPNGGAGDWFALEVAYRSLRSHLLAAAVQRTRGRVDFDSIRQRLKSVESALGDAQKVKVNATAARTNLDAITKTVSEFEERIRAELDAMDRMLTTPRLSDD